MSTPAWLAHYLLTTGAPDPRHAGRQARPRGCPTCGRLVLHGADHHRIAAYVDVDPYALTKEQEAAAIISGAATYSLNGQPPRWELNYRTLPGVPIVAILPPASETPVVAAHSCNRAPYSDTALATRAPKTAPIDDEPSF